VPGNGETVHGAKYTEVQKSLRGYTTRLISRPIWRTELVKGRLFPAIQFTPSRDLSEPKTSPCQTMVKDETLYKEMQLKQSANETKIL